MIDREQLERLWASILGLGARRLAVLGMVGLMVFAAVGLGSYFLTRPEMETLYAGLNGQDVGRIGTALSESGIPFDVNAEGTAILVPVGKTSRARMLLAEKGLPSSTSAGYELFDKLGAMGLTSFMQEVTRVRALEGEIARTIQGMKGIKAARVHIVLPDSGSFRRSRQPPSASVMLRTEAKGDFSSAQAIRHLVAAAVPGMTIEQVSVMSTDGTMYATGGDAIDAAPSKKIDLEKTIAKELQDNVRKTLAPYLGLDNFEISVAARLNIDKRQTNETEYDPETRFERSQRTVKETSNDQSAGKQPSVGVEQNLPIEEPSSGSGSQSTKSKERKEELRNFELNSKTTSTVSEGYRIENLTIAVVINRKRLMEALGKGATQEQIDAQLKEVERIASSATGLDSKRGDRISVAAVEFLAPDQHLEPVPGLGIVDLLLLHSGTILKAVTILGATFLLAWFGLRPMTRMLLDKPDETPALTGPSDADALAGSGISMRVAPGFGPTGPPPNLIGDLPDQLERTPQKRLEQLVEFDDEKAASILKQWMREPVPA